LGQIELVTMCLTAFSAVFFLLAVLAGVMHLITLVFPEKAKKVDATYVAAISASINSVIPGAKITRIEEKV